MRNFKIKRNILLGVVTLIFEVCSILISVRLWYLDIVAISTIMLVVMYVGRFIAELRTIPFLLDDVSRIMGESKKPLEILNTPHEIVDKTEKKLKV